MKDSFLIGLLFILFTFIWFAVIFMEPKETTKVGNEYAYVLVDIDGVRVYKFIDGTRSVYFTNGGSITVK